MSIAYLIVANGPCLGEAQLKALAQQRCIIALDGAADRLKAMGMQPDILLGDFDSLHDPAAWGIDTKRTEPYRNASGLLIVPAPNQHLTDLQKAIDFCDAHDALSIEMVCVVNGRFDHTISNVRMLKRKHKLGRSLVLHTESQSLLYLENESYTLVGKPGDVIGLFGFPHGYVSSKGLAYELNHYELRFAEQDSVANTLIQPQLDLAIEGEVLLVGPCIF